MDLSRRCSQTLAEVGRTLAKGSPPVRLSLFLNLGRSIMLAKSISILSNARKPDALLQQLLSDKRLNSLRDCKPASGLIDFKSICVL